MSSEREVVRLLKPDSQGHMQRIFSAYSFSSGTLEVLAFPSFPTLLKDLIASGPLALPAPLDERALFMVRPFPLPRWSLFCIFCDPGSQMERTGR